MKVTHINVNYVETKEILDMLENTSALTIEGLAENSYSDFIEWVEESTPLKERTLYVTKGKIMNKMYNLTGDNAYPEDCSIVSIPLTLMEISSSLIIRRFEIGARWFDDIVSNNRAREDNKS